MAVAGAVLSPSAAASPGRGGASVVVSSGKSLAVPAKVVATTTAGRERAQEPPAVVRSATSCSRRLRGEKLASPRAADLRVVPLCDKRRAPGSNVGTASQAVIAGFVVPPTPAARHRYYQQHQHRARGGRSRWCASSVTPRSASFNGATAAAAPSRKRPLAMNSVAEAVAAAAAMASALGRSVPSRDDLSRVVPRSRSPFLRGLDAGHAVAGTVDEPVSDSDGGISTRMSIHEMLVSFLRWLLSAGGLGSKRPPPRKGGPGGGGFPWRLPFFGGRGGAAHASASDGTGSVSGSGTGSGSGNGSDSGRTQEERQSGVASSIRQPGKSAATRKVQRQYARPQSTAYARPKVSVPTLLDLDVEEALEVLPPRKDRQAMSTALATVPPSSSSSSSSSTSHLAHAEKDDGNPLLSKFLRWFFERVITRRAKLVEGLEVRVDARSNRDAMSGLLQAVGITFNHLELETVQISGGATMRITGLDLKVMTLLWRRFRSFKKPFEVAGSYVFNSVDLATSPMVRRLVENMMNATLRKLETLATDPLSLSKSVITIMQVTAKRSRLVIDGAMVYDNVRVPFNYRTSIGVRGKGHVVYLKDPEVFWENVGGSLSLPLLPLQTFDIDIGDAARIESIRIVDGQVAVRARFVLSPFPPLVVASMLKRASFRFDVGERLSVTFGNLVQNMRIM